MLHDLLRASPLIERLALAIGLARYFIFRISYSNTRTSVYSLAQTYSISEFVTLRQNLALQRFPVAKWMSINVFVWAVALCTQAACHSFGALFACRLVSIAREPHLC